MEIITQDTTGASDGMLQGHLATLRPYVKTLREAAADTEYGTPETALAAPRDEKTLARVIELAEKLRPQVKTVLLVGIGGSDLGTRAIYEALHGHSAQYGNAHTPKLLAFATVEPRALRTMSEVIKSHDKAEEVVLIVISKSGSTAETIANGNVLFQLMSEKFGADAAARQTIAITNANSSLAVEAGKRGVTIFEMPLAIGGRYSVFSPVGLVPLAILGIDVRALCEGANKGVEAAAPENGPSSAALLATILFESYLQGSSIHELFMFNPELEMLGKWYRQLLAESIGKERVDGTKVGIMPTVAIGSTDLHSLGQLVFGGPQNRFTTFISAPSEWDDTPKYEQDSPFTLSMLEGKQVGEVMKAIYAGVRTTYKESKLPFLSIEFSGITERELGAFMTLQMASIMYLAKLFDVNAFDQPAVETYKNEARRLLTK